MESVLESKAALGARRRYLADAGRSVFDVILSAPEGLELATVYKRAEQRMLVTGSDDADLIAYSETLTRICIGLFVRAGWLTTRGTQLAVSEEGRNAYSQSPNIERLLDRASRKSLRSRL